VAGVAAQEEELLADVVHPSVVPDLKLTELRQVVLSLLALLVQTHKY
jgi:hypothetical protein